MMNLCVYYSPQNTNVQSIFENNLINLLYNNIYNLLV